MSKIPLTVKTDQEAFDAVVRHLATLKGRAFNARSGSCVYATHDGRRCAVGALLDAPNEQVRRIHGSVGGGADDHIDYGTVHSTLLEELQGIHDDEFNWADDRFAGWPLLADLAKAARLDPAVLEAYAS